MSDPASRPQADDANGSRTHLDPAIEASQRAWAAIAHDNMMIPTEVTIAAAREALRPIRELHFEHKRVGQWEWTCKCGRIWPCATAKLIYSDEELNRDR